MSRGLIAPFTSDIRISIVFSKNDNDLCSWLVFVACISLIHNSYNCVAWEKYKTGHFHELIRAQNIKLLWDKKKKNHINIYCNSFLYVPFLLWPRLNWALKLMSCFSLNWLWWNCHLFLQSTANRFLLNFSLHTRNIKVICADCNVISPQNINLFILTLHKISSKISSLQQNASFILSYNPLTRLPCYLLKEKKTCYEKDKSLHLMTIRSFLYHCL